MGTKNSSKVSTKETTKVQAVSKVQAKSKSKKPDDRTGYQKVNYELLRKNAKFTKKLEEASKEELVYTCRLKETATKPSCNDTKEDVISILKENGIKMAVDMNSVAK